MTFFKKVNEKQFQRVNPSRQPLQRNFLISAYRKKVRDSEIAVSVSVNDMRKELLKDVKKDPKYNVLNNFLKIVPDDTEGFKIFTHVQSEIDRFTNEIYKCSSQKIYLSNEMPPEVIMSYIKKFLEDKNTNEKDRVVRKFYRYVKKVVSLEYKNLKHIPKRRYYNPAADINTARQYLLQDIKGNHQYDYMNVVLQIPVDRNKGIDLSSDLNTNTACLNTLSNVLNKLEIKKYLDDVISQQNGKNSSFNKLLEFLKSQESQQSDPINKNFLGYIIRVIEIEYRGINQPLKEKVEKTTQSDVEKTLFPNGSPKIEDIKQGRIGDCYLLAALMSIIRKNPECIKRCFPGRNNYDINQKTVKVKLHKVKVNLTVNENHMIFTVSSVGGIIIEVDNTILMKRKKLKPSGVYNNESHLMPFGNQTKALWVNFMEKAFSVYKNIEGAVTADNKEAEGFIKLWKQDSDHSLSGQNVNGGWEFMPFAIITGKESKSMPLEYVNYLDGRTIYKKDDEFIRPFDYSAKENKIFNYIYNHCKDDALTAGTKPIVDEDASRKEIFPSHAYSIESTRIDQNIEKKYIVLKNPHMKKVIRDPNTGDDLKAGTIVLELSDFVKYFKDVNELDLKSVLDKN